VSSTINNIIEQIVLQAHEARSGVDVVPIRLLAQIRSLQPALQTVEISQIIDALGERGLGRVEPPSDDPGERLFYIDHNGVKYAEELIERDRSKSLGERIKLIPRSDWIAILALLVSLGSLAVSALTYLNTPEKEHAQTH
jgi:hypothetical protein